MPTPRTCEISDECFGGFTIIIDLDYYHSLEAIAHYVKGVLVSSLSRLNLVSLAAKAENKKFHIHDKNLLQIHNMPDNTVIWVCGHC